MGLLAGCDRRADLVDSDTNGFALYRSGWLDRPAVAAICRWGVEEMVVLDGTALERECRYRRVACPQLRIRANPLQDEHRPLDEAFLLSFDRWVEDARLEGRKIALRCRRGWHRTGRLVAYYRMRFAGWSADEAIAEMRENGRLMWRHRDLIPQVRALESYIRGEPCGEDPRYCVEASSDGAVRELAEDLCPPLERSAQ